MPAPRPGEKPGAPRLQDRPHVERGDELYFRDSKGAPWTGKVLSHGEHGCTVELAGGKRHQVRWEGVLGHRRRMQPSLSIVDQGEDGFVTKDIASGELRYVHDPLDDGEDDEPLEKALPPANPLERLMAIRATQESPLEKALRKNAPGLVLKDVTDKAGRQTKRWSKASPDAKKPRQAAKAPAGPHQAAAHAEAPQGPPPGHHDAKPGDTVRFKAGAFEGEGKITHVGPVGAVIVDRTGRDHKIKWDEVEERKSGPKLTLPAKGGEKPSKPLAESHEDYFHTEGSAKLDPSKLRRQKGAEPDSGAEAEKRMRRAAAGGGPKRSPIRVTVNEDGSHTIEDGHATHSVAVKHGWKAIPAHVVQPHRSKGEIYKAGGEAVDWLKDWLNKGKGLADKMGFRTMTKPPEDVTEAEWMKPGGMLFIAKTKGLDRATEKVETDYGGDWSRIKDIARCTLAVDTVDELRDVIARMKASGMVEAQPAKDRYAGKATGEGYRDVNMVVRAPNGHLTEVQVNTKAMMEAKNEGHHHYEVTRKIVADHKDIAPEEWDEATNTAYWDAVEAQKKLYGAAEEKLAAQR